MVKWVGKWLNGWGKRIDGVLRDGVILNLIVLRDGVSSVQKNERSKESFSMIQTVSNNIYIKKKTQSEPTSNGQKQELLHRKRRG